MRTITNLINEEMHVLVKFRTKDLFLRFLRQAEEEGFKSGDKKPTDMDCYDLICVLPGKKLCYVGFVGHYSFYHREVQNVMRIDYEKYINMCDDYLYTDFDTQKNPCFIKEVRKICLNGLKEKKEK